jgi:electron transfer flavoprotein alpha subunit
MTILLLADHDGQIASDATARTVSMARELGQDIHIFVAGDDCAAAARHAAGFAVEKVLHVEAPHLAGMTADAVAAAVLELAPNYGAIIAPATALGKSVLPRVAARLDVAQVSEVTKVVDGTTFERPIYAGNAIETVKSTDSILVATVRASAFPPAAAGSTAPVEGVTVAQYASRSRVTGSSKSNSERPELASADIVISGGRALASSEQFEAQLGPIAAKLGAALGASRAAVDAGYAPNDLQVGQTGKIIAPSLYIAVGISGAIQHLAGMKDAKVVVAINKDPDAPIFKSADYGLVGDLFTILPELDAALAK